MKKYLFMAFLATPLSAICQGMEMSESNNDLITIIIFIILFVILFFVLRELFCWYYKFNRMVDNQERIISLLEEISSKLDKGENQNQDEKKN